MWEKNICWLPLTCTLTGELYLQPRHLPQLEIRPVSPCPVERCPTNWATLARALCQSSFKFSFCSRYFSPFSPTSYSSGNFQISLSVAFSDHQALCLCPLALLLHSTYSICNTEIPQKQNFQEDKDCLLHWHHELLSFSIAPNTKSIQLLNS